LSNTVQLLEDGLITVSALDGLLRSSVLGACPGYQAEFRLFRASWQSAPLPHPQHQDNITFFAFDVHLLQEPPPQLIGDALTQRKHRRQTWRKPGLLQRLEGRADADAQPINTDKADCFQLSGDEPVIRRRRSTHLLRARLGQVSLLSERIKTDVDGEPSERILFYRYFSKRSKTVVKLK